MLKKNIFSLVLVGSFFLLATEAFSDSAPLKQTKKISASKPQQSSRWEKIYLASYPRSGNHWVRYLIEEATRIATSSVYRDQDPLHLPNKFPWGGYCPDHGYEGHCRYPVKGEPVVIKTHFPTGSPSLDQAKAQIFRCKATIRIIRHPIDTFYSYYVFMKGSSQPILPTTYVKDSIKSWEMFQEYWDQIENVVTIRYEDLYHDPHHYLKLILDTIGYRVTQKDIDRAVAKHPPRGGLDKHHHHFLERDLAKIREELGPKLTQYGY